MNKEPRVFKLNYDQLASLLPESSFDDDFDTALQATCQAMNADQQVESTHVSHLVENLKEAFSIVTKPRLGLLRSIRKWALDCLKDECMHKEHLSNPLELPQMESNDEVQTRTRVITAQQALGILANAFLANVYDTMVGHKDSWNDGGLDWRNLLLGYGHDEGVERMKCHLLYFDAMLDASDLDRRIVFERIRYKPIDFFDETNFDPPQKPLGQGVNLHNHAMEQPPHPCTAFVNFANPNYGYGKFIGSCTQEEILESCCPEITIGLLFIGKMADNEVVNVRNVRRFATYSGYLDTFKCQGQVQQTIIQDILTMDACTDHHFSNRNIQRDLNKAYFAFRMHAATNDCLVISTGKWGCGAFDGQAAHKFAQQVLAANVAGVNLEFSVFRHTERCDVIHGSLKELKPTAAQVAKALQVCKDRASFVQDFHAVLLRMKENQVGPAPVTVQDGDSLV